MYSVQASIVKSGPFDILIANTAVLIIYLLGICLELTIIAISHKWSFNCGCLFNDRLIFLIRITANRPVSYSHWQGCSLAKNMSR
jgi:hypothetical protein